MRTMRKNERGSVEQETAMRVLQHLLVLAAVDTTQHNLDDHVRGHFLPEIRRRVDDVTDLWHGIRYIVIEFA